MCTCACVNVHVFVCVHVHVYVCVHVHVYVCVHVHVYVCVHVHVYETGWEKEPPGKQMLNAKYPIFHLFKTQLHVN